MRNMPVWMSHDELVGVLADIHDRVRAGDSFEGSIEYLIPGADDGRRDHRPYVTEAEWLRGSMVRASYRIGNLQGQGSLRMIGEMRDVPEDSAPQPKYSITISSDHPFAITEGCVSE